ncbi:MAG TPA: transcriptional regulator [Pirellulaceae bacterium]|nr:transcriptional regulator [Pirellulaceae bacterium]
MSLPNATQPTEELPKDVADLAAAVALLPAEYRSALEPLLFRVVDSTKRRRRILNLVQEALSQLRLDMKYLVFDLEATRRERDALREGPDGEQHRGDT